MCFGPFWLADSNLKHFVSYSGKFGGETSSKNIIIFVVGDWAFGHSSYLLFRVSCRSKVGRLLSPLTSRKNSSEMRVSGEF